MAITIDFGPGVCTDCGGENGTHYSDCWLDIFDDDHRACPLCGGPGVELGALGNTTHYRCRNCGVGFSPREAA